MKASVVVFPASNCDRDVAVALHKISGQAPDMVWHGEASLGATDLIVLPGGFSYGDYLRSGAMAAQSPIMRDVVTRARAGTPVLGICNGFQILTEAGLLPGVLMRNANLKFICRPVELSVETTETPFTSKYVEDQTLSVPIAHHDGNYFADADIIARLKYEDRIVFRYRDNPNGSLHGIAGIVDEDRRVLGMMPHPERAIEDVLGGCDGKGLFESVLEAFG